MKAGMYVGWQILNCINIYPRITYNFLFIKKLLFFTFEKSIILQTNPFKKMNISFEPNKLYKYQFFLIK